ncbi:lipoprotein-releasing ABC transporter permease subunit [Candidatus Tokpelaia sp.]|uniref:lipoprotein-releasing ABC transporter permease subunit n=1 Tax=Candidatus Tokpelaia sp. TaxID=2233777 RepID=UPI001239DB2B|nr:lipoprotein-releasing ABC transporter permease subunit [Candidatus Tokpelaia sp.]KAA6404694.1 lipoprotein-releasing ABC transporter permease subunit [Candidatus Tokpelaia sp.]
MDTIAETNGQTIRPFAVFEWLIAFRYMWPNRKQIFTSVITIISFIGIVIGVWALIVVMSVMNGFRAELLSRILGMNGHIIMQPVDGDFADYAALIPRLDKVEGVKFVLPVVEGQVLAQAEGGSGGTGAYVRGLREQDIRKLTMIADNIKQGSLKNFDKGEAVAIGSGLAEKLALGVGDAISLVSPDGDATPFGISPRLKTYKIGAIYEVGMSDYDAGIVFMPLREAQLFFNQEGRVQSLEVFVTDPDNVDKMLNRLEAAAGRETYMLDWRQRNQSFFSTLQVERNVMFIILSLIVLVAALNIISGLVMLVKDKGHDIAVLRTMGARRSAVMRIFMIAGASIGIGGTFFGLLLGIITCLNLDHIQAFISWISGIDVFNKEIYFLSSLPSKMDSGQALMVVLMALALSFLATLAPAWYASRLDPVQALRYE